MTVNLTFTQDGSGEDLDLHFIDNAFLFDLTPCVEPFGDDCSAAQGQSTDSNETYYYSVPIGGAGEYSVVVHGWDGSSNTYSISITVQ